MQRRALPPIVKAKLSPPQIIDACVRPQTLDLFRTSTRRRVTLISAPAGYGKTTVAVEAMRRLGLRAVWYKLDVLDQDPVTFIASLVEAFAELREGFGQAIRDRLANAHEVPYPAEQLAAEFVSEATDRIADEVHLVLDDYHEAADSRALNAALDYLVANLPVNVRFVVLSRYEPAFGTAKLRLQDELGLIGVEHLRFGSEEVLAVVERHAGTRLSPERATILTRLTEGWPASVVLAALAIRQVDVDALEHALADPRLKQDVFSYLAEQVYMRETPEVRAFLRRTCCLEYVTANLAARLGAPRRVHRILDHLVSNGVFTFATAEAGVLRYHGLFREFLRQKAIQEDGSQRFHRLRLDTAAALEAHGDIEKAVDLCLCANEPGRALEVVSRAGEANLDAFRSDILTSWLERLPDDVKHARPWARLIAGQLSMRSGGFDRALAHIDSALERCDRAGDRRGLYHALSAKERTLFWQGDTAGAVRVCRRALDVAEGREQRVHTLISLGAALEAACHWTDASKALQSARKLAAGSFPGEMARVAAHITYISSNTGRYRQAASEMELAARLARLHGSPSLRMALLNFAGMNSLFLAEWDACRDLLEEARKVGHHYGYLFMMPLVDDVEAQMRAAVGDTSRSNALVASAIESPSIAADPYCRSLALCHAGTTARRSGHAIDAVDWYRRAVQAAGTSVAPYAHLNASANLAFTVADCACSASSSDLPRAAAEAERLDLLFVALKSHFFAATLEYRHGERKRALALLDECVPRQVELGHLNFLVQELVLQPEMATDFLSGTTDASTVETLLNLIAQHWNAMPILLASQEASPASGVAATVSAVKHRSEADAATMLGRAARSSLPEVRKAAAALRRTRRASERDEVRQSLGLTRRELQILAMMAEGHANPDIAARLFVSPATVKTHVNHIFAKLGVRDRVQAVLRFRRASEAERGEG